MKKIVAAFALVLVAAQAHAWGPREQGIVAGIAGTLIFQHMAQGHAHPAPVYPQPAPVYAPPPQPAYGYAPPRVYMPEPRIVTSTDYCQVYGQMVMTYDQWNRPMGYQVCR